MKSDRFNKSLTGIKWNFLVNFFINSLQIIQVLLIAKVLNADSFYIIGIIIPIISAFFLISEFGFGAALIQKETDDIQDYAATVLVAMLTMSLVLGIVLYIVAPFIASFYERKELIPLVNFVSVVLVVKVYSSIISSLVIRNMDYRHESVGRFVGVSISFLITLYVLFKFESYWAAIHHFLTTPLLSLVFYFSTLEYTRVRLRFSYIRLYEIFNFSFKLLAANLIFFFSRAGMGLVLAKIYPGNTYGSYYFAQQTSNYPRSFLSALINKIIFSGLSAIQHDTFKFKFRFLQIGRLVTFFTAPVVLMIIFSTEGLFNLFFGAKWNTSIYSFQCLMVFVLISTIGSIPTLAAQAKGYVGILLKANLIRLPPLIGILVSVWYFNLSLNQFVTLFVVIEVIPATYCIYQTLKVVDVSLVEFCNNFLLAPALMLFSISTYKVLFSFEANLSFIDFLLISVFYILFYVTFRRAHMRELFEIMRKLLHP